MQPRWAQRLCLIMAATMAATVAVPNSGPQPAGPSRFPLAMLWDAISVRPAWAVGEPSIPKPGWPGPMPDVHLVDAESTRAHGGSGHAPGHVPGALAEYQLPRRDSSGQWTTPLAPTGFDKSGSHRDPALSTASVDKYRNPDGSITARIYDHVVNYQAADGSWAPIDTTLVAARDGWRTRANSIGVRLAGTGTSGGRGRVEPDVDASAPGDAVTRTPIAGDLVSMTLPGGQTFAYTLQGAMVTDPAVSGSSALYSNVLPDTDLRLSSLGDGLKETLVLRSRKAPNSWVFPLKLTGLSPRLESDGSVTLIDVRGARVMTIPHAWMHDSKLQSDGDLTTSRAVTYKLTTVDGAPALQMTADRAWLDDPARVYPIEVDPTATVTDGAGDVYVDGSGVDNGTSLGVGCFMATSTCDKRRAFLDFSGFDGAANGAPGGSLNGKYITAATLHLYHTWAEECGATRSVYAYKVTQPWSASSMPNGRYPGASIGASAIGSLYISDNHPACNNGSGDRSVGRWWPMTIDDVSVFNQWASSPATNYGIALTSEDDNDRQGWKRFTSRDYSSAYAPWLELTWSDMVPPQVDTQSPANGAHATTLTPELVAAASDPDNIPSPVQYWFGIYDSSTPPVELSNSGWGLARSWQVPAGKLQWGKTYWWTVQVWDGNQINPAPRWHSLSTLPPQPLITSHLSQNGGKGFEPSIGNYTTSAIDASVPTVGPALSIVRSYNSRDPRQLLAFGNGWSSIVDTSVTELEDPTRGVIGATIRYPSGQDVTFGKADDGTFVAPQGRYATLTYDQATGYKLVDKDGTTFLFTPADRGITFHGQFLPDPYWHLASITDANGRALTFIYEPPQETTPEGPLKWIRSTSGRQLMLTWNGDHVTQVDVQDGAYTTLATWKYTYSGDSLMSVCPPVPAGWTQCIRYTYGTNSLYPTMVTDVGAHTYLRLGDPAGTAGAVSATQDNQDFGTGTFNNLSLGQAGGPLAGSSATVAGFNGTTSSVSLPNSLALYGYQTMSLWFKTSIAGGVLYGQSWDDPAATASTVGGFSPTVYIGSDGKLRGRYPTAPQVGLLGSLTAANAGRCLDVAGGDMSNGTAIHLWDCHGGWNQQWSLNASGSLSVTDGSVTKCLDANGAQTTPGTPMQLWDCNGAPYQSWTLRADGRIVNAGGNCLDVVNWGTANGTPLQLWTCVSNPAQPGQLDRTEVFFPSLRSPMVSSASVADGQWHQVVLTASGNSQQMYVDGGAVGGPVAGKIQDIAAGFSRLGTGYVPSSANSAAGSRSLFNGSMAEFAFFDKPLPADQIALTYNAAMQTATPLTKITRPLGVDRVQAQIAYNTASGAVSRVTDENGGTWDVDGGALAGTDKVYAAQVLASGPADYFRFIDNHSGAQLNEVNGTGKAWLNAVTLGVPNGPFGTATTVASFDGTTSYVQLPPGDVVQNKASSVSMWFKMPAGSTVGGVLYGYQTVPITETNVTGWVPALYVDSTGKLRGGFWTATGHQIVTPTNVNDGVWHHVVLTASETSQSLYLDGALVGTPLNETLTSFGATNATVGAGVWNTWPSQGPGVVGYWPGQIAEYAFYSRQVTPAQVTAQFNARTAAATKGQPVRVVTVTNPAQLPLTYTYDVLNGRRLIEQTDANKVPTTYRYDVGGFLRSTQDPNGNLTVNEFDARGNIVSTTTCQDRDANRCGTSYRKYFLDPNNNYNICNDTMVETRDARTDPAEDTRYRTTYTFDPVTCNRATATDPLGRVTTTLYTDGTTSAGGHGGAIPPKGLPWKVVLPSGAVKTVAYLANGDAASTTDAAGLVTAYAYNGLGQVQSKTETFTVGGASTSAATSYAYDLLGRVVTTTKPLTTNAVTGAQHRAVITVIYDADGHPTSSTTVDQCLPAGSVCDASRTESTHYDLQGRPDSSTDTRSKTTTYTYNVFGLKTSQTDPAGVTTSYTYTPTGLLATTSVAAVNAEPLESRAYDPGGRLSSIVDANRHATVYEYTDDNLTASVVRQNTLANPTQSFTTEANTYDLVGNLTAKTTNNGATTTTYAYDFASRKISSTLDPAGVKRVTNFVYGLDDALLAQSQAVDAGPAQSYREWLYDGAGQMVGQTVYNGDLSVATPVGRWRLNGNSLDGAGNVQAQAQNVTWATDATKGQVATFDGTSAIKTSLPVVDTTRPFSISVWAKPTASVQQAVVQIPGANGNSAFKLTYYPSPAKWKLEMASRLPSGANGWQPSVEVNAPAIDTWAHLVATVDPATGIEKLYVNGGTPATGTATLPFNNRATALRIGDLSGSAYFRGSISDVQVYQKALTSVQVAAIYTGAAPASAGSVSRTFTRHDERGLTTEQIDALGNSTYLDYDMQGRPVQTTEPAFVTEEYSSTQSGPAGWWKLDETSGTTASDSGSSGKTATLTGNSAGLTWSGGAATLAGATALQTSGPVVDTAQSFTVSAWASIPDTGGNYGIVGQEGVHARAFSLQYNSSANRWAMWHQNSDSTAVGSVMATSANPPAVNTWTHLVGVFDVSTATMKLYVNGLHEGSVAVSGAAWASTGSLAIGRGFWEGPTSYFKGSIDNIQVYQRVLSDTDVSALYGNGRAGSSLSAGGAVTVTAVPVNRIGLNTFGEQTETQDPKGRITVIGRDAAGNEVSMTLPKYKGPGLAEVTPTLTKTYDNVGRIIDVTDPLGNKTTNTYDTLGRVSKVTFPNTGFATYTYDLVGNQLSTVDPSGAVTLADYDFMGRQKTLTQVDRYPANQNLVTTYVYNGNGFLTSVTPPPSAGRVATTWQYNNVGETTQANDGGNISTFSYDFAGRQIKSVAPDGSQKTATFDAAGNAVKRATLTSTNAVVSQTSAVPDAAGRPIQVIDGNGHTSTYAYDVGGRLVTQIEPISATSSISTSFGYDLAGSRTRVTDGRGSKFYATYNSLRLTESTVEPATAAFADQAYRMFTTTYNAAGQPVTHSLPGGVSATFTYDVMGRLAQQTGAGAEAATADRTFDYDAAGRIWKVSGSGGINTLTYNDRGLPLTITGPSGDSSFTWTDDSLMASRMDTAGTTNYTYDNLGRLARIANTGTSVQADYTYDSLSRVSQIVYGGNGDKRLLTYDLANRRIIDELKNNAGTTSIAKIAYTADANGNQVSKIATGFNGAGTVTNSYSYDWANRLTSWNNGTSTVAYAFDKSGNRIQAGGRTFTYNERNQLLAASDGTTYQYTARGTLLKEVTGTVVTKQTLADAFGQVMTQYSNDTQHADYTYDGLGRAIKPGFSYTGTANDLASDGSALYTRGPTGSVVGVKQGGNAALAWTDRHSDVVGQFTPTSTVLSGSTIFDPYGKVIASTGMLGNLGYQSEYTEALTGRVNMAARWYNPDTGQFDTRDTVSNSPEGSSVNANRYAYANANPLSYQDPSGHGAIIDDDSNPNTTNPCAYNANNPGCSPNNTSTWTSSGITYESTNTSTTSTNTDPCDRLNADPSVCGPHADDPAPTPPAIDPWENCESVDPKRPDRCIMPVGPPIVTVNDQDKGGSGGSQPESNFDAFIDGMYEASIGTIPDALNGLVAMFKQFRSDLENHNYGAVLKALTKWLLGVTVVGLIYSVIVLVADLWNDIKTALTDDGPLGWRAAGHIVGMLAFAIVTNGIGAEIKVFAREVRASAAAMKAEALQAQAAAKAALAARRNALATDPAIGNRITPKTLDEADAGLGLEARGELDGPIRRDPSGNAEFFDAHGRPWDVKSFNSNFPNGYDFGRAMAMIRSEIGKGEGVILNTKNMSAADIAQLRAGVQADPALASNVRWYP